MPSFFSLCRTVVFIAFSLPMPLHSTVSSSFPPQTARDKTIGEVQVMEADAAGVVEVEEKEDVKAPIFLIIGVVGIPPRY